SPYPLAPLQIRTAGFGEGQGEVAVHERLVWSSARLECVTIGVIRQEAQGIAMSNAISPAEIEDRYERVEFTADLCIKCNICTAACPVAPVTELFPGPKTVGPQAQRFRHPDDRGETSPDKSVDYCSGCGMCTLVCPHGVKVMEMNTRARARLYDGKIPLRNRLLGRSELLGKFGHWFAPLLNV